MRNDMPVTGLVRVWLCSQQHTFSPKPSCSPQLIQLCSSTKHSNPGAVNSTTWHATTSELSILMCKANIHYPAESTSPCALLTLANTVHRCPVFTPEVQYVLCQHTPVHSCLPLDATIFSTWRIHISTARCYLPPKQSDTHKSPTIGVSCAPAWHCMFKVAGGYRQGEHRTTGKRRGISGMMSIAVDGLGTTCGVDVVRLQADRSYRVIVMCGIDGVCLKADRSHRVVVVVEQGQLLVRPSQRHF